MTVVSTREFRANQTRYLGMASRGEKVILKSRLGHYRLMPEMESPIVCEPVPDYTAQICQGMRDFKEFIEEGCSSKFRPARELSDELRNL